MHKQQRRFPAYSAVFAIALLALVLTACQEETFARIDQADNYPNWNISHAGDLVEQVPGHPVFLRRIYANDAAYNVDPDSDGNVVFPEGALFMKEMYFGEVPDDSAGPDALVGMYKDSTDPRNRGGWVWFSQDPATGQQTVLDEEFCITCHANANEEHPYGDRNIAEAFMDYVYYPPALNVRADAAQP